MKEKLLNVKDVSDLLNVSKSSIYNYAKQQTIPTVKLNGRLLFSQSSIDSWIDSNKCEVKKNETVQSPKAKG